MADASSKTSPIAVGIDLGTTYSAIAVMNDLGRVEVLRNAEGDTTTPSVVLFDPNEREPLVGREAQEPGGGHAGPRGGVGEAVHGNRHAMGV